MVNQPLFRLSRMQSLLQCIQHQLRVHRAADSPTHDPAGKDVDDEGDVHEARPGGDEREIRDPQLVGSRGREAPLHSIQRFLEGLIRDRRARPATAYNAPQALLAHQPLHGAASHRNAFPMQLFPHFAGAVGSEVLLPHAPDRATQLGIALHPLRKPLSTAK
jgi:hypothetical protein